MTPVGREHLVHMLYEAAELEHNLMCTYLYAAFSLRDGPGEGLLEAETAAVARWRRAILDIAIEEMGHLVAVWNITAALGAAPRFGRGNFPLDPGFLPAQVVVKLAPFNAATLQHFIFLERPHGSSEPEGDGFALGRTYLRGTRAATLTPMAIDYDAVGGFYAALEEGLTAFVDEVGEDTAFRGNPALQVAGGDYGLPHAKRVQCLKTALAAFASIVSQGEGSTSDTEQSHYQRFLRIREEFSALRAANPAFQPAFPAATNPVLRRPPNPDGRVWLEDPQAIASVDLANASYGLMVRLLAYSYAVADPQPAKAAALRLAIGLMRALVPLAEHAARLPAGDSNPGCHAGVSFTALRDSAALPVGAAAEAFFRERLAEFADAAAAPSLSSERTPRLTRAARQFRELADQAARVFPPITMPAPVAAPPSAATATPPAAAAPPASATAANGAAADQIETAAGRDLDILFSARRCIHARFCVTGAPRVFLANVQGPWIHPDAMPVERLVDIAHACPSGAIRYLRHDGQPQETAPPVNLAAIREAGPYAFRGALLLRGVASGFRATLCRCGASKNKPYCDGSHHEIAFSATGEPPTGAADMLPVRDGPLIVDPLPDGPLEVTGNLEITSGTGRVVARTTSTRLCRCGGSQNKPFCDGTHARNGFRAE